MNQYIAEYINLSPFLQGLPCERPSVGLYDRPCPYSLHWLPPAAATPHIPADPQGW